jgi:hypothetical protein
LLAEFRKAFPDKETCAAYLRERRWPNGFVCPFCSSRRATPLKKRAHTHQCLDCRRQTTIASGTVMHKSKLPLKLWFSAAHLIATHPDGMSLSVRRFGTLLGIKYKTAWLLKQKLRQSMNSEPLKGHVEVGLTKIRFRGAGSFSDPTKSEKVIVVAALETSSYQIRLAAIPDESPAAIETFIRANVMPGATLLTKFDLLLSDYSSDAHQFDPLTPQTFGWLRSYRRRRREPVEVCLGKFVVFHNDRLRQISFETVLGIVLQHGPTSYWDIIGRSNPRTGVATTAVNRRAGKTATGMKEDGPGTLLNPQPDLTRGR